MSKFFALLILAVLLVGCAPGSYLDRLGNALVDRAPGLASEISEDPSPLGIGSALFQWIVGAVAAAGAGGAAVGTVKLVRRNRLAAAAVLTDRVRDDKSAEDTTRIVNCVDPPLVP